jgi:tRNA(Leu) C34 or U34 (ribose-2'-O)-methylase TrmL
MSTIDSTEMEGGTVSNSLLIITNISKRTNVRTLLQVGVAFGCVKILIVGQKSFNFTFTSGDDDSEVSTDIPKHLLPVFASGVVKMERFDKWQNCVSYLQENFIALVGVEIHTDAKTIQEICNHLTISSVHNKRRNDVAFLMGNEGTGLQEKQMHSCDMFCRIPQYGGGTASLNVYVAASIVLYHFHQYQRRQRAAANAEPN